MNYIARKYAIIIFSFCFSPFAFTQEAHLSILDSLFNHSIQEESRSPVWSYEISHQYYEPNLKATLYYFSPQFNEIPIVNTVSCLVVDEKDSIRYWSLPKPLFTNLKIKEWTALEEKKLFNKLASSLYLPDLLKSSSYYGKTPNCFFKGQGRIEDCISVEKIYKLEANGTLLPLFRVTFTLKDGSAHWVIDYDPLRDEIIEKANLVLSCFHTYPITKITPAKKAYFKNSLFSQSVNAYYTIPLGVESPNHGAQNYSITPSDIEASPFGWHDTNGMDGPEYTITRGNNVHAYLDLNNEGISNGDEPDGGENLIFYYPYEYPVDPEENGQASVVNLFHACNQMHDITYLYGFREVHGNFQFNNYGKGGVEGDYLKAESMDGGGINNANMYTPIDGQSPRMQMYLWNTESPFLDASFDNGIIYHEYAHGISNRLVGGASNVLCLTNAEQMGEGISDFFGFLLNLNEEDISYDSKGVATFLLGQDPLGEGLRIAPYSSSFSVNDYTYADISQFASVHDIGFLWATVLWDMTLALIDVHGFDPDLKSNLGSGNAKALQLVMESMKLMNCEPGFVDARDAILLADELLYGGSNACLLWTVFAKRGLGINAYQGNSDLIGDEVADYEVDQVACCSIPSLSCKDASISLDKEGMAQIEPHLFILDPNSTCGELSINRSIADCNDLNTPLDIIMYAEVEGYPKDSCQVQLTLVDTIAPVLACKDLEVNIEEGDQLVHPEDVFDFMGYEFGDFEGFNPLDIGDSSIYVSLGDDDVSLPINLGFSFPFYGGFYQHIYIGSNGFVTFSSTQEDGCCTGPVLPQATLPNNLIAMAWDDYSPGTSDSINRIRFLRLDDGMEKKFILEFHEVNHYPDTLPYTAQLHLFENGMIEIHTLDQSGDGPHTMGLEDLNGEQAFIVPGRNGQPWQIQNDFVQILNKGIGGYDNCGIDSFYLDRQIIDCSLVGQNPITLYARDDYGNISSCTSTLTVVGQDAPTLDLACNDLEVYLGEDGFIDITIEDIDQGSQSNCGDIDFELESTNFNCIDIGLQYVQLFGTIAGGVQDSCQSILQVLDTLSPQVICKEFVSYELVDEAFVLLDPFELLDAYGDNCGLDNLFLSENILACDDLGFNEVDITLVDFSGNQQTCSTTIHLMDQSDPVLYCPESIVHQLEPASCGDTIHFPIEVADNCSLVSFQSLSGPSSGDYIEIGMYTVEIQASDGQNTSTCSFGVEVLPFTSSNAGISCWDTVFIYLEDSCVTITPDQVINEGLYGCPEDFVISTNLDTSSWICCDFIGQSSTLQLLNPDLQLSCSATLMVLDSIGPKCILSNSQSISCMDISEASTLEGIETPVFYDNCGISELILIGETSQGEDFCNQGAYTVLREWMAIDLYSNSSNLLTHCYQTIQVERSPIYFPLDTSISCSDFNAFTSSPIEWGGIVFEDTTYVCDYSLSYVDQWLPNCNSYGNILRTWTVFDWCTGQLITQDVEGADNVQLIEVLDNTSPLITSNSITLGVDGQEDCKAYGVIPLPSVSDACSEVEFYSLSLPSLGPLNLVYSGQGTLMGGQIPSSGLSPGAYDLQMEVADACGNVTQTTIELQIEDFSPPVSQCLQGDTVYVNEEGQALLSSLEMGQGSSDACCLDGLAIRVFSEPNDLFVDSLILDCSIGWIEYELRSWDCSSNQSFCSGEIFIADTLIPWGIAPMDTSLSCLEYTQNVQSNLEDEELLNDLLGAPQFFDNCPYTTTYYDSVFLSDCGQGVLIRQWQIEDASGNTSDTLYQEVEIHSSSLASIEYPADTLISCSENILPDLGSPIVGGDYCGLFSFSYEDEWILGGLGTCYQVERSWHSIDWCLGGIDPVLSHIQYIDLTDDSPPQLLTEMISVSVSESDCLWPIDLSIFSVEDCSNQVDLQFDPPLPQEGMPPGQYSLNYLLSDFCGNQSSGMLDFYVMDDTPPTPDLIDTLFVELLQGGSQVIYAEDFNVASFDNCSILNFSFSQLLNEDQRELSCVDLGVFPLEIWGTDEENNSFVYTSYVQLEDPNAYCSGETFLCSGQILTPQSSAVSDVLLKDSNSADLAITNTEGIYDFEGLIGESIMLTPYKNSNPWEGVTTYDVVLLSKHILGIQPLEGPYYRIAADANNSQSITTLDVVALRKLILQIEDGFPSNKSWRFVPCDYVFSDPEAPWGFEEYIYIDPLNSDVVGLDFKAIKIGDLNGSVNWN